VEDRVKGFLASESGSVFGFDIAVVWGADECCHAVAGVGGGWNAPFPHSVRENVFDAHFLLYLDVVGEGAGLSVGCKRD